MSGRDTAYVWIGRASGGRPEVTRRLLERAGLTLLGHPPSRLRVTRAASGRPRVTASDVELPVSVSHDDQVVVVAACRHGPIGVDVERRRPVPAMPLAHRWFEPAAVAWLRDQPAADRAEGFLLLWTAKEAVGKALGVGLRGGGTTRPMPHPTGPGPLLRAVPGVAGLRVGHPLTGSDLVVAIAVAGTVDGVVVVD